MRHDHTSGQVFMLLRRHGVPRRTALRIIAELAPPDPVARLEQHEKGVVFAAAVAHYLRLCGVEHTDPAERVMVKWDLVRLAWIVMR